MNPSSQSVARHCAPIFSAILVALLTKPLLSQVIVTPTTTPSAFEAALKPAGLGINAISIRNGDNAQFGTYIGFTTPPITIADGVVMSSGDVSFVSAPADPILDFPQPSYDMNVSGTQEFDDYGPTHIENFLGSYDVAALQIDFTLENPSHVKFDFIFGSVEFPYWTSSYTDSFLAFLIWNDGDTNHIQQVTFDRANNPVQVGVSFTNLVSLDDQNSAFANPHGLLRKLTTTTARLDSGDYTLIFEVGDVNDHILDSAVFITNLRAETTGTEGTEPTHDDGDVNLDERIDGFDVAAFMNVLLGYDTDPVRMMAADMDGSGHVDNSDIPLFVNALLHH